MVLGAWIFWIYCYLLLSQEYRNIESLLNINSHRSDRVFQAHFCWCITETDFDTDDIWRLYLFLFDWSTFMNSQWNRLFHGSTLLYIWSPDSIIRINMLDHSVEYSLSLFYSAWAHILLVTPACSVGVRYSKIEKYHRIEFVIIVSIVKKNLCSTSLHNVDFFYLFLRRNTDNGYLVYNTYFI